MIIPFKLDARVKWVAYKDQASGEWVGVCDALSITACGETWTQLQEVIAEIQSDLLQDLMNEGSIDEFLQARGWTPAVAIPDTMPEDGIQFDIPAQVDIKQNDQRMYA